MLGTWECAHRLFRIRELRWRRLIPLFTGYDPREAIGWSVFSHSVIRRSSVAVQLTPLVNGIYGVTRVGTNAFTYLRFLIPYLMGHTGFAIYMDGCDMLIRADIAELWELRDHYKALQVVQHDYRTTHPRKYIGSDMETENADYPRKNWSSVMLINCAHRAWRKIDSESISTMGGAELHQFSWMDNKHIGTIPFDWNHIVGEYEPNIRAKLVHYSLGGPWLTHYSHCEYADEWYAEHLAVEACALPTRVAPPQPGNPT